MRLVANAVLLVVILGCAGEWKPTGDGKTVVNTRTGELRVTSTGESVQEFNARVTSEKTREKERREASALQAARLADEERLGRAAENGTHYHEIQLIVCGFLPETTKQLGTWWSDTKPFRQDRFPTKSERDELLRLLERLGSIDADFADRMSALRVHLQSLQFDSYGRGEMVRTPDQLRDSSKARQVADERDLKKLNKAKEILAQEAAEIEAEVRNNQEALRRCRAKWLTIRKGLTQDEVKGILGAPDATSADKWTFSYRRMIATTKYRTEILGTVRFDHANRVLDWDTPEWNLPAD